MKFASPAGTTTTPSINCIEQPSSRIWVESLPGAHFSFWWEKLPNSEYLQLLLVFRLLCKQNKCSTNVTLAETHEIDKEYISWHFFHWLETRPNPLNLRMKVFSIFNSHFSFSKFSNFQILGFTKAVSSLTSFFGGCVSFLPFSPQETSELQICLIKTAFSLSCGYWLSLIHRSLLCRMGSTSGLVLPAVSGNEFF